MAADNNNVESIGITVCVIVAILSLYFLANLLYQGNRNNAIKSQKIRIAKIEACRSITDESLRMHCIVQGGTKESE